MKKIAVITGASSGIGREFVRQVSKKETFDEIWVIARSEDRLNSLKAEITTPIKVIPLDLAKRESLDKYKELLEAEEIEVSLLANISGFGKFGKTTDISLEDSIGMIELNCTALTAVTYHTLPYLKRGSKILEFDSISAFQPVPYINVYAATKAYVLSFTRALASELRSEGIRVMAVCPYWVKTAFFDRAQGGEKGVINYFNVMYTAEGVVKTAIKDLYHTKKDVSVHGKYAKFQRLLVKILPHKLVMRIWKSQQKLK
jgi:short-subunit dehydrogenase